MAYYEEGEEARELAYAKKYHENPVKRYFTQLGEGRETWGVFQNDVR